MQWNTWSQDTEHDHRHSNYNKDEVAAGVQNFLICIEMFFAALAHAYAFPPKDYMDPSHNPNRGFVYSLRAMFDVRDVVDDVEGVVNDTVSTAHAASTVGLIFPLQFLSHRTCALCIIALVHCGSMPFPESLYVVHASCMVFFSTHAHGIHVCSRLLPTLAAIA